MEVDNPATREIYVVEYHVIIGEGFGERLNDSFELEGSEPSREALLQAITSRQPNLDWSTPRKVTYTVSRLMNNNTHIVTEQGAFDPADWSGAPGQQTGFNNQPAPNM